MMWKAKWSRFRECFLRKPVLVLVLLPCVLLATLFIVTEDSYELDFQYPFFRTYNIFEDTIEGYLVWNAKCHMVSKNPLEPSIVKFVKKEKYEPCTNEHPYTQVVREANGSMILYIDPTATAVHRNLNCCWSSIVRPKLKSLKDDIDSTIILKSCQAFKGQTVIPEDVQVISVTCKSKSKKGKWKTLYENVHAILNPAKVRDRLDTNISASGNLSRKLSVLVLGIDSVSRLNFLRTVPKTEKYLRDTGWIPLKGYNKMADNTFPNLMAILTGQNQQQAYSRCKPTVPRKLDECPFLWQNFRNAGYVTAYGEDEIMLNTFNYLKVGFVEPPTDYYLRPYMLGSERLTVKKRFNLKYCTGPETSFDRIFDYGVNFARTFLGVPYFGFFWTNTISHDNMNGLSMMDARLKEKLQYLEQEGVLNDTMIIFLSDHGMRWGGIRNTFVGWYEERLPFIYIWLPEWFRNEYPQAYWSLRVNQYRLASPFDLYQTLRHVIELSGGEAEPPPGCATCHSLLERLPRVRGCDDAGIAPHWCACAAFKPASPNQRDVREGAQQFLEHVEGIVKAYKDKKGNRLCARLKLKKIHRADQMMNFNNGTDPESIVYFYMIEVTPGGGKFEVTVRHHGNGSYSLTDDEVSRINPYASGSKCLNRGMKQYCQCVK